MAVVGGVPLFLCMPPWNDVTLHDLAARNILRGGIHYRDVFDTNLPGIDWSMAAIRAACGWSYEALRAWDLAVVGTSVGLLCVLIRRSGGNAAWFIAAVALFYPFTSEFNQCQRDVWMMLPAVGATLLRGKNLNSGRASSLFSEGAVWGIAVWFKPHAILMALAVWLVSLRIPRVGKRREFLWLLAGGVFAGAAGIAWLVATGAWPYFVDIFTRWNPEYLADGVWSGIPPKAIYLVTCFLPWGVVHVAAIPTAVLDIRRGENSPRMRLAALYLGWIAQAVILQKQFDYVFVPTQILGLAVVAARGWLIGVPFVLWFALVALVPALGERHPLTAPQVLALWPRCWKEGSSPELRDRLGHFTHTHWGTNWEALCETESYLKGIEPPLRDRELTCWNDSTHPLYLSMNLEPSARYLHFGTVLGLRDKEEEVREEVMRSPQRCVVAARLAPGPRDRFPWTLPVVHDNGRYVVFRVR
jgi:hypothetical protein